MKFFSQKYDIYDHNLMQKSLKLGHTMYHQANN